MSMQLKRTKPPESWAKQIRNERGERREKEKKKKKKEAKKFHTISFHLSFFKSIWGIIWL